MPRIKIVIPPNLSRGGSVRAQVEGVKGLSCRDITDKVLGSMIDEMKEELTEEAYQTDAQVRLREKEKEGNG